ncbi:dipeptidase [Streptomyces antibioticus]|uniref:dipeptidase n=1 Tax=Streptomyces antibioticus TaxID=1890 RepID=UPI0033A04613
MLPPADRYSGYRSYSYLRAGTDYKDYALAPEVGRVPAYQRLTLNDEQRERVERLLRDSTVISLHEHPSVLPADMTEVVDLIRTGRERTGFEGLARSGMTALFDNFMDGTSCVTSQAGWKWSDIIADLGMRFCDIAHQEYISLATSVQDIRDAHATGRLALVAGLEASTMIENELDRIDILYGFGVRQMGIAYSEANMLGSGFKETRDGGLTAFGHAAVERMNRLGMAIDISHSSDQTCRDVIAHSQVPVFITHAGARSVWNTNRMKPDDVIKACAERGGVIGLEAAPHTTLSPDHPRHSLESVMDHFTYLVDLVGIDHVAFGPDTMFGDHVALHDLFASAFSIEPEHATVPKVAYVDGLENPAECFYNIISWLVERGYSDQDIRKVVGENIIRVLEDVWI